MKPFTDKKLRDRAQAAAKRMACVSSYASEIIIEAAVDAALCALENGTESHDTHPAEYPDSDIDPLDRAAQLLGRWESEA
jgi:hypothetical protein